MTLEVWGVKTVKSKFYFLQIGGSIGKRACFDESGRNVKEKLISYTHPFSDRFISK